ncbi:MAG: valine--tRNA ligase, partial [Bdellovibrionales bacterium]|nr:valine--tRNA ligase [Bdellovibrionales bacterium]
KTYKWWQDNHFFSALDQSTKPPFSATLPPPNVTGMLHMGHALDYTLQDVVIRYKRMMGFNAMWMPGQDHAGIATQAVVEKELMKKDKTRRQDLGREKFLEKVWEWKETYGNRILEQCKRLGLSLDWDRARFTLDEKSSRSVEKAFVDLFKKGLIYRGTRLVNWSPKLESAISDLEVDNQQQKGLIYHIKYPIEGTSDFIQIATTRPETLLGDTAVAVHPEDTRYKHLIGKHVILPVVNRKIMIIADTYVDQDFGSGAVKITPAHDFNDYQLGKRHDLEMINILNRNGTLNENTPKEYQGLSVKEAREKILTELKTLQVFVKEEPHTLNTPLCSRTGCVVEPMLSQQWFVKINDLAIPAKRVVESGTISFEPEMWTKTYLHWMNNIDDWCISRQLWWGHRIPVWYCKDCNHNTCAAGKVSTCEKCNSKNIEQDEDVLDTWFSSALWPFSTLGWPEDTEALKTFYPNDLLITGHDIIFFWVARMIMMGLYFQEDVPFRKVYMHGIVRDSQGRKMSKSLGNGIDPLEIIEKEGADALRFCLLSQVQSGKDLKFSEQRLETSRNFMNKIWNASRFSLTVLEGFEPPKDGTDASVSPVDLSLPDIWITQKLADTIEVVNKSLLNYKFSEAANALYHFTWNDLCDWYIEFIKPIVYGTNEAEKKATQMVLAQTFNRTLRLLSPFIPFITEELFTKMPIKSGSCMGDKYPTLDSEKNWLKIASKEKAKELDIVKDVIVAIRNIRGENRIKHSEKLEVSLVIAGPELQKVLGENKSFILQMAGLKTCAITDAAQMQKCAVNVVTTDWGKIEVVVPLEGLVDFDEEVKRVEKSIEKLQSSISVLERKFNNESFIKNAPPEIVEADKLQMENTKQEIRVLSEHLQRLK